MRKNTKVLVIIYLALVLLLVSWLGVSLKPQTASGPGGVFKGPEKSLETVSTSVSAKERIQTRGQEVFYAPVLMYHHIAKKFPQDSYYVSPEIFDQQMTWLAENDYHTISYDEFSNYFLGFGELPDKPVVITFDDGDLDHYTNAFPILKKHGFTATFFIKLNNIGENKGGMTWSMIKELSENGMTIGSHSVNHKDMAKLDQGQVDYELLESKKILEEKLNTPVKYFAYPGGAYSKTTIEEVKKAGYLSAVTTRHRVWHNNKKSIYEIPRIHIDDEMPSFIDWIQGKNL